MQALSRGMTWMSHCYYRVSFIPFHLYRSHLYTNGKECSEANSHYSSIFGKAWDVFTPVWVGEGVGVSTCSHTMHYKCYLPYLENAGARERGRLRQQSLASRVVNFNEGEFTCPLCKRLSNCAIPLLPRSFDQLDICG